MNVTISVGGKFHAFYLAEQLQKKGLLGDIFTPYPRFALRGSKLPPDKVHCLIFKEVMERGLSRIPYLSSKLEVPCYAANIFDRQVARRVKPCDIFVGWSGFSLHTLRRIRGTFAAKIILEHNIVHIGAQRDILRAEEENLGIKLSMFGDGFIEKELREYEEADYIAVPSTLSKQTFLDKGFSPEKIICVPHGVDVDKFRPASKSDNRFRIIAVGMRAIKGIHYLLKAVDELKIKDLELWLIGGAVDPELKPFLKKYSGSFKYLGAIPNSELYKYYSQGSVSALFSLSDGFGFALSEAMACGVAVICSDSVGAKDLVRDNIDGFIIPTRDTEKLKEKILYLYENPNICLNMGRSARENVANNFTWDNYGERVISIYHNLLKRS